MDLLEAHGTSLTGFDGVVHQIEGHQWDAPTPCSEWTVRDLVNHLVYEQLWVPWLLRGATLEEVGDRFEGDMVGSDPIAAWEGAAEAARAAWMMPGAAERKDVHVSTGLISAEEYGWQMVLDLAVHGWDLARAIDVSHPIEDELAGELYRQAAPEVDAWQSYGIFAPVVPVADDADPVDRLVALLGRNPHWPAGS